MRSILVTLALLLVAASCGPSRAERAQAVFEARIIVQQPASDVGTFAEAVVAGVTGVRLDGLFDPVDWLANVDAVAEGPVERFAVAVATADGIELNSEIEEVLEAQQQWVMVRQAATELLAAANSQLDELTRVIAWDLELEQLTDAWQESGSRNTQLERFAENAELADQLVLAIRNDEPTTCPAQLERRVEAAEFVAATTRELRDHILNYRGTTFDERRVELAQDPTGLGAPLSALDGQDAECWSERAGITDDAILEALEGLQAALNPPDL